MSSDPSQDMDSEPASRPSTQPSQDTQSRRRRRRSKPDETSVREAHDRAERATNRAIAQEHRSIAAHEAAARLHDSAATHNEERAASTPDGSTHERLLELAAQERERAKAAKRRAQDVRDRLNADHGE